ncbi:MAG: bifunctional homocysteine S-methyltransferase/methylenetetrahydrofolate reductase [Deltaproteobacteria bacterium]|nr:bifunctional homocysteine S-methyltransferase/methylenetetrahydrofolate reductase [Deltaproteobacteria bacterium]
MYAGRYGTFREIIRDKKPLLLDGALGTELYNRGVFINQCFEHVNLSNPELVKRLHEDYLRAGAMALSTNSWGANYLKLRQHNLHDQVLQINTKAVELARGVAGDDALVFASVGPLGVRIEPFGPTSFEEARKVFREQVAALAGAGADAICFETFSDLSELQQGILAVRDISPDLPLIASVVIGEDQLSPLGSPLEWMVRKLDEWAVDVIGLNCSVGPQPMMNCVHLIREITDRPLSMRPNAGLPKLVDGRHIYMSTPEYMAHFAQEFFQSGVQFVGGCCGTSPSHIRAMANVLRYASATAAQTAEHVYSDGGQESRGDQGQEMERVPAEKKSGWAACLARGETVYSVELLPPSGISPDVVIEKSRQIRKAGVHAINIPDGPRASARMSAILTAVMIEQQAGIETVLHYTCRDRNLLGMQSDMLGAQAIGLRNLLLVTGDPPKLGNYPNATGVFDVDSIGLTNMVHRLNGGIDLGGRSVGAAASLSIGVGVNPVHHDPDYEMKRFEWKVRAGAEWAITQPVFDVTALFRFLDYMDRHQIRIPVIAGVWPLMSYRNALFMQNEVPGVEIPCSIMERMAAPASAEDSKKVGVEIAREMVEQLGSAVQGIQVSAPFGRIDLALQVIGRDRDE